MLSSALWASAARRTNKEDSNKQRMNSQQTHGPPTERILCEESMEDNPCRLLLLARLILRDRHARVFQGVPEIVKIASPSIEHGNLVALARRSWALGYGSTE